MKRFIYLALALLLIGPLAFAIQPKTFNWTPPALYENGLTLPDGEIASYNIYCNALLLGNVPNTGGTDTWTSPPLPDGTYSCHATTMALNGEESVPSNTSNFTVEPSKPGPPTGFSVSLP